MLDYTTAVVAVGCVAIGVASGIMGSFALLRRESLMGDAVAHCALPGIAFAFLFTGERTLPVLLAGAFVTGGLGALCVGAIARQTRLDVDGALGLVLASFFGLGLALLTYIQKLPTAAQAGLDAFLFGQAAAMLTEDVIAIGWLTAGIVAVVLFFWKEWKLVSFDRDFAASLGWRLAWLDGVFTVAFVVAVVVGLQAVGVVLTSALVVASAAAARQWTNRLAAMVALAAAIGALAGVIGVALSGMASRVPTGATIVLTISAMVALSLLLGRERGVLWRRLRRERGRRGVLSEQLLLSFYQIASQHDSIYEPRELGLIGANQLGRREYRDLLDVLVARGWVECIGRFQWALTPAGRQEAERKKVERHDGRY